MNLPFEKIIESEIETEKIAKEFAKTLSGGDVVTLTGNLGSGKTFFVKQACRKLQIENVSSPSFAIVNEYNGLIEVNHFDFYRIKKVDELYDLGFSEYLDDDSKITFIEWAEMYTDVLPKKFYSVVITILDEEKRKIRINKSE